RGILDAAYPGTAGQGDGVTRRALRPDSHGCRQASTKGAEMKENLLDVLLYLFENTLDEDTDFDPDRERLLAELEDAGFHRADIHRAFDWLEGLANADPARGLKKHARHAMRGSKQHELFCH